MESEARRPKAHKISLQGKQFPNNCVFVVCSVKLHSLQHYATRAYTVRSMLSPDDGFFLVSVCVAVGTA